jgi:imidazolonepropionase-like amidohydrolase
MAFRMLTAAATLLVMATASASDGPVVLAGGTLVDGYGGPPLYDSVVVIEGERITAVGTVGGITVPEDAELVSTEGMTVLPGLWDMQVRLARLGHGDEPRWAETYLPIAERVVMPLAANQLLSEGVTSARVLDAPLQAAVSVRDRIRDSRIPGPTLFVTGPQLGKLPDHREALQQWQVEGEADARSRVAQLAAAGADYVLLAETNLWKDGELQAAVNEARVRNLAVFSLADRAESIERSLGAGVDGFLGLDHSVEPALPEALVEAIRERATDASRRPLSWSPAISALLNYEDLRRNPEPLDDPRAVEGLPPLIAADVLTSLRPLDRLGWYELPASRAPNLCTRLGQLGGAGVELVLGSDSGAPAHLHSRAAWQEIDYWVRRCGLDAAQAIRAATHDAATAMRVEHESGTVTPGKYADIIAVRGDVLRNPALLQAVDIVFRRGHRYR